MPKKDRSKNRCQDCGHSWFPGSMEKAMLCPRCDSSNIHYGLVDRLPAIFITIALAGFAGATVYTLVRIALSYF